MVPRRMNQDFKQPRFLDDETVEPQRTNCFDPGGDVMYRALDS